MSEKYEPTGQQESEKEIVPYEKSLEIAESLLKKYEDQIREQGDTPPEIRAKNSLAVGEIGSVLKEIPEEIREKFWGHGITKGWNQQALLGAFINIIENSTIKGDEGLLSGGAYSAYTRSQFFVISHFNKHLATIKEDPNTGEMEMDFNEIGWVADVGAFVVNYRYYPIVDELREMFPGANIIKASELPKFIEEEVKNSQEK